jgi:16S rRNA (cytidine1402-2'-O)-methyltransferase
MPGRLFVVSTPIGNLEDITLRALSTLKTVHLIAAEDTRRTGTLLKHFNISTPTTSYHEHNERQKLPGLLEKLADGHDIALVSDAGTPVVADPGQRLTAAALDGGFQVIPVPGASAVMSALSASGFPADQFVFLGFAPSRSSDRTKWISELQDEHRTIVLFEAPHRIDNLLTKLAVVLVDRPIFVGREMTKLHEQGVRIAAAEAVNVTIPARGEFTVVVGPRLPTGIKASEPVTDEEVTSYFEQMTNSRDVSRREAVSLTAKRFGLSTNNVYALLERLKAGSAP